MEEQKVIVQVDKTVVGITGVEIRGLNTKKLEDLLKDRLKTLVRVIGVTGESIEMDVYGIDGNDILKDESGIIKALSLCEGISVSEVAKISHAKRIKTIPLEEIPPFKEGTCSAERWLL